jgi:UDP-N-acetylmuramoylalanine--D-glutamate ligase
MTNPVIASAAKSQIPHFSEAVVSGQSSNKSVRIAILGYGIEGKSTYKYLKKSNPSAQIDIYDEKPLNETVVKITTVKNLLNINFAPYDTIVRSPSLPPKPLQQKITADKAGKTNFNLTSATQIFFDNCPSPIIGVTGTKGKGSTASFIAAILKTHFAASTLQAPSLQSFAGSEPASEKPASRVWLVGNIGLPALDILPEVKPNDVVVYELSSFQLWDLTKSPHVAVLTIFEPDHLNIHSDFDQYVTAKSRIVRFQAEADFVIYNSDDQLVTKVAKTSKAQKLPYPDKNPETLARPAVKLAGDHQVRNAEAAILAARAVQPGLTDAEIEAGLSSFDGLPHRLKFVREVGGVQYYDDSIATTPGSAIAAIKSFSQPKILIIGGSDKGADYTELGAVAEQSNVRQVFAIGANRQKVKNQVVSNYNGKITLLDDQTMAQLLPKIAAAAKSGDVVIMSPAAASFDMFRDYKDRGQQFIDAVESL